MTSPFRPRSSRAVGEVTGSEVGKILREAIGAGAGDTVALAIEPTKDWPEPKIPQDITAALAADPQARTLWTAVNANGALGVDPLDSRRPIE